MFVVQLCKQTKLIGVIHRHRLPEVMHYVGNIVRNGWGKILHCKVYCDTDDGE